MADYFTTHVWQQNLPLAAMTALDKLVLHEMLDHEVQGDAIYFYGDPEDYLSIDARDLETAMAATPEDDPLRQHVEKHSVDWGNWFDLDFSGFDWARVTQQILRRNRDIPHIAVIASYTCSKMRRDGFGGALHFITADDIKSVDLMDIYEDLARGPHAEAG